MFFIGQKSIFRRYCIQNVKDGIQFQVYNINNDIANHFGQFILVKVEKNLREPQFQSGEKVRELRLRQNYGLLIKNVYMTTKTSRSTKIERMKTSNDD